MRKLVLSLCACCSFANLASSADLWAYNGCHMAEARCSNAERECSSAQGRASGKRIDNFRGGSVESYYIREANMAQQEAERVCANAISICSEKSKICAEERRQEAERQRRNNM
ncbi:MAG: hypothetical protein LBT18_03900 [Endomicrobium sp.]|nr:hypothetical protein [Endomicrobium sp.]